MQLAHRWASRNLSRLELAAAVIVIATLCTVFMGRGLRLLALAEEQAVRASVLNMNSSLRILFYRMIVDGRAAEVIRWQGANPVALMQGWGTTTDMETAVAHPELARFGTMTGAMGMDYAGERNARDPAAIGRGQWYFEQADGTLVYRVRNDEFFRSLLQGPARVRYRLEVRFDDPDGDGAYNPATDTITDVGLVALDEFTWIEEAEEP